MNTAQSDIAHSKELWYTLAQHRIDLAAPIEYRLYKKSINAQSGIYKHKKIKRAIKTAGAMMLLSHFEQLPAVMRINLTSWKDSVNN
jgi:hypothetical protein